MLQRSIIAAVAILGTAVTFGARAADEPFCRDYARTAVNQLKSAEKHRRCEHLVRDQPNRWTGDYRAHYDWCRSVQRDKAREENNVRRRELQRCEQRR